MQRSPATLVSADTHLIHLAQAAAAASSACLEVVSEVDELRHLWRTSSAVLIGSDLIGDVVGWALPRREQVFLVGETESWEILSRWSVPLGASVIQLPDGAKWLSTVIAGRAGGLTSGTVVALRGGAGGVGTSTLAVGLAVEATRRSLSVALVDCDPQGGGLDLLVGAENTPGWRWDKLRNAVGQIADISPMLPKVEGFTLVSMERASPGPVPDAALEAVVDCLARTHDLVLMDLPRIAQPLSGIQRSVVVSAQTVRAIAATRVVVESMDSPESALVVRKGGSVGERDAAHAVNLPLIAVLPHVADLPRLADRGIAPLVGGAWKRACGRVLEWCLGEPSGGQNVRRY